MILPKGTVDFSKNGGEGIMEEMIETIRSEKRSGYILILGSVQNVDGVSQEITAQLLFDDGVPRLCESVMKSVSLKGETGLYDTLRAMENPENTIEMHSKIDVGPPMAFFKECRISDDGLDIGSIKEKMAREEGEKKKREEERKNKEEQRARIKEEVEGWTSSGFKIGEFPEIMTEDHDEIIKWHTKLSKSINEIESIVAWASGIEDIEVKEGKEKIMDLSKEPSKINEIMNIKKDMENHIDHVTDKRGEMEKWVNLWKDEGYNTGSIEKTLNSDLETAWNSLANFMDDIQRLKDYREELEKIKEGDTEEHFGPEIREIDFLLNDPMELNTIEELLEKLKETIRKEKEVKEEMISRAKEWESKGYEISSLMGKLSQRLDGFRNDHTKFMNNISRIEQIKDEINALDKRDLAEEIDGLKSTLTDPFQLETYEESVKEIKDRIDLLNSKRKAMLDELALFSTEGFLTDYVMEKADSPVNVLTTLFEDFRSKVSELKDLGASISDMDHRWLEDDFRSIENMLLDITRIEEIKNEMADLQKKIDDRERSRQKIRSQMEEWEKEGFMVTTLSDVIEGEEVSFTRAHDELKAKIEKAREFLKDLGGLNVKFFPAEAKEVEELLHDPGVLGEAIKGFESLKEKVTADWEIRNDVQIWMEDLKKNDWTFEDEEEIMDSSPNMVKDKVLILKNGYEQLKEAITDIESWDPLESKYLESSITGLKDKLHRISEKESALSQYEDLKVKITSNHDRREHIKAKLEEWKQGDFIIDRVMNLVEGGLDELNDGFEDLEKKIGRLIQLTDKFDSLNVDHFRSEAEEIEFQLNDPYLIGEIEEGLDSLMEKIDEDNRKRESFRTRIEDYVNEGFMGARKLEDIMNEDISIVEIEFKNFEKEVQLLRKYMTSTGFNHPAATTSPSKEKRTEKEKKAPVKTNEQPEPTDEGQVQTEDKADEPVTEEKAPEKEEAEITDHGEFIVGLPNEVAHKAAFDVAERPGDAYNPLLILGDIGSGKTHLLNSMMGKIREERPNFKMAFFTGKGFLEDLDRYRKEEKMEAFRDIFRESDALMIEDLQEFGDSEDGQDMFINIMTGMLDNGKQVVMTSNRDIKAIPKIAEQIRARLDTGISVDLEGTSEEFNNVLISSMGEGKIAEPIAEYISGNMIGSVGKAIHVISNILEADLSGDEEGIRTAKEIVDRITGDPEQREIHETLENTLKALENGEDQSDDLIVCTNCDKDIPADSTNCPHCGAIFEEVEMKECPVCKNLVELEVESCPNCGLEF